MKGRVPRGARLAGIASLVAVCAAILGPAAVATTPLSVSKTAEARWTRTFEWTIDKSVTPALHELLTGESGTSTYTIVLTKSAGVDSPVTVAGEVCVTNNGAVATENLTIVDRIVGIRANGTKQTLASGSVDTSANPVLDPGESYCYPYSFVITPSANFVAYANEARITITNDPREPGVPLGPSTSADFTIPASPTLINDSVNVDDTNGGSWLFNASGSVSYQRTFTCDQDEGTHNNTATIRETGQSDSASVEVRCVPPPGRGCTVTPGYWKTHSKYGPAPYDNTWALIGEDTTFFLSGMTWYQVINTPPSGGNAYYILSFQYIAARLNVLAGASTTPAVDAALAWATTFFSTYTPATKLSKPVRDAAIANATTLANYNNGLIGPGHC